MQIVMIHTRRGSADGFTVRKYKQGETYDMSRADELARQFIRAGDAEAVSGPLAEFNANRDAALAAAEGNPGLTHFLNELSASAVRVSKERIVQNPNTLLATGEL